MRKVQLEETSVRGSHIQDTQRDPSQVRGEHATRKVHSSVLGHENSRRRDQEEVIKKVRPLGTTTEILNGQVRRKRVRWRRRDWAEMSKKVRQSRKARIVWQVRRTEVRRKESA